MALSVSMPNRPRPTPDWLDATTTRQPHWLRRAMASSAPGMGFHSSGDLMNWSESTLMTPSRSRMMSFIGMVVYPGLCDARAVAGRRAGRSGRQARDVGHLVHQAGKLRQQRDAVGAGQRLLGHHHDVLEELVHSLAQAGERAQRVGVVLVGDMRA